MKVLFSLFLPVALIIPVQAQTSENNRLSLDLYLEMESVSNPRISPDGTEIAYTRGRIDKVNDDRESDLWIMNADGGMNRFLVNGSDPRWSPDGGRIAFTASGEPKGSQIFVMYHNMPGPATQITHLDQAPSNITWSPDGEQIAFSMFVPSKDPWSIDMPEKPEGAKWTESPRIIQSLVYRRDRRGFLEEGFTHLFVVPAEGGTPRQITGGDWNHNGISWSQDGEKIFFSSLRVPHAEYAWRESEIYSVDVDSGEIVQLTNRIGPDGGPVVSPNNLFIAYTGYDFTDDTYIERKLYVMDIDGSNPRELAAGLDRSPNGIVWSEDNFGVYFNANDSGTRNFYFASVDGTVRKVTDGNHMLTVTDVDKEGHAVGVLADPHRTSLLVSFDADQPAIATLLDVNDDILRRLQLGEVEEINYKSTDNYDIQGWVIKPPDFDPAKKYPLILAIHGGPHGMYNVGFNFAWQVHAAKDYVVLYTNPRGSSGYGSPFGNAIKNAYPGKDYDDLMNGVDAVLAQGYVDENNMFVYGCSGGGVLTSWVVGHTTRFAAASANCPVTNWLSFVGTTDGANWYRNFEKLPWEDPSEHLRRSPLMYVGNVETPTMLMTGVNDLRTPISQTEEYYQALKVLKVDTAMLRFNDEFHGTSSNPSNYLRTQLYLHYWFNKYRREPEPGTN